MRRMMPGVVSLVALGLLIGAAPTSWAQDPLVEGAKKEGKLMWYTTMNIDDSQPLLNTFMKKYPFIKAELWRGSSEKVLNRIQTETRAGKFLYDVVAVNGFEAGYIKAEKLVQPYLPSSAKAYRKGFVDPEGYWVDIYDTYYVIGYNTKMVSKADAPKDWNDLLDPKWKEKFSMDPEDHAWFLALQEVWGREKAEKFGRALAAQNVLWRKGHTLIANLLAAGEFPLGLVYAHRMEELKRKGAPVEWVTTTDPIPAELHPIQIGAKAPNPNAAKLFIEFMASKEGQTIMRDLVRIPAHPEVQLPGVRPQDLRIHGVGIVPPSRANQIIKEWREIFNPSGA